MTSDRVPPRMRVVLLVLTVFVAGCAGAPATDPAIATPSASPAPGGAPTPSPPGPTPPSVPTPTAAPTPIIVPEETTPTPAPEEAAGGASDFVEPAFASQERIADAADPGAFADVNPFEYQNPWRD